MAKEGYEVMGQEGPIELGEDYFTLGNKLVVQNNGDVYVAADYIDTLDITNFSDTKALTKMNDNLFTATGERS